MIYLDNAATTYPKPQQVYKAWYHAIGAYGANPGRSGHAMSVKTSSAVFESRAACADFFGADPENTCFTLNCTHALNFAIKGLARRGAHYVISDLEHNAVIRPVHAVTHEYGGSYTLFEVTSNAEQTVYNAERAIRSDTAALVCTAASNVTGRILPLKELARLCKRKKICFIVDAAQGSGVIPISINDGINIICASGHKGLYGPMGTGLMITDGSYPLNALIEGGTGSASESLEQPDFLPDRFESGTINTPGVIALGAGINFVKSKGIDIIYRHETRLCRQFFEGAQRLNNIALYEDITQGAHAPVVAFNIRGHSAAEASQLLSDAGFYLRGGLHCAPLAHKKLGTLDDGGTLRLAPSVFTSKEDIARLLKFLSRSV
ncbi:MAG: aminotransferase class V-fold PLP-dependent enzyme [Oscillospiraceae bacterium]